MPAEYGSLQFKEAIAFFRNKLNVPTERWADVWQTQHNTAFSVAGAMKKDLIADFRNMVDAAIADGKSVSWFKSNFKAVAKKHGWDFNGSASWRANIIYSTNVRQAYNAGRYEQLQSFEYWRYVHGDSLSPRLHHQKHDQLVLPKSSPFWNIWFPQNGWGCKCKVFGESERSLKRKGLKVGNEPKIERREWIDKATGEAHEVPVGIDPGFDYAPGKITAQDIINTQETLKPALVERLEKRVVPSAFSTVPNIGARGLERISQAILKQPQAKAFEQFTQFLRKYETKTIVVNSRQMGRSKSARAIMNDVATYLDIEPHKALAYYTSARRGKPEGFTHRIFNHVVIKGNSMQSLQHVDVDAMLKGIQTIFKDGLNDIQTNVAAKRTWYFSSQATGYFDDNASRYITWLHEMGHQVHYKAGMPKAPTQQYITQYGKTNDNEWFAEHFVFYALANEQMRESWPEVANWFDDIMKKVLL